MEKQGILCLKTQTNKISLQIL